ncbi:MAG: hypothetical protein LBH19_11355 [Dysgonamonadaceae bacterium]|jgi:hypothetical protein|nr:hypothetical protein [Dysgonamonadaceae bacterium]
MKHSRKQFLLTGILLIHSLFLLHAGNPDEIEAWITTADRSSLFTKQEKPFLFGNERGRGGSTIIVDERQSFQSIDGSVRIASTDVFDPAVSLTEDEERAEVKRATIIEHSNVLPNVAFKTPNGKIVLIVANDTWSARNFRIQYKGRPANIPLAPGSAGTYIWDM